MAFFFLNHHRVRGVTCCHISLKLFQSREKLLFLLEDVTKSCLILTFDFLADEFQFLSNSKHSNPLNQGSPPTLNKVSEIQVAGPHNLIAKRGGHR